jgi:hypothetical protein
MPSMRPQRPLKRANHTPSSVANQGGAEPGAPSQDTCLHLDNGCGNRQAGALIQTE